MKIKIKYWDRRKAKKARFKRYLARARKRGEIMYGGYIPFDFGDDQEICDKYVSTKERI